MEATPSTAVSEQPTVEQTTLPAPQVANQLKVMLSQARGTRQMLLDFKAALDDCTVHGSHVYHMALGLQFVNSLVAQSKADIDSLQAKIEAESK